VTNANLSIMPLKPLQKEEIQVYKVGSLVTMKIDLFPSSTESTRQLSMLGVQSPSRLNSFCKDSGLQKKP
jgi:hypothetical protein